MWSQMLPMQLVNVVTDELEMFLSMARMVKTLPKQQYIQVRMKLSQMVCEAELQACQV